MALCRTSIFVLQKAKSTIETITKSIFITVSAFNKLWQGKFTVFSENLKLVQNITPQFTLRANRLLNNDKIHFKADYSTKLSRNSFFGVFMPNSELVRITQNEFGVFFKPMILNKILRLYCFISNDPNPKQKIKPKRTKKEGRKAPFCSPISCLRSTPYLRVRPVPVQHLGNQHQSVKLVEDRA
jgi:hypothetical protein